MNKTICTSSLNLNSAQDPVLDTNNISSKRADFLSFKDQLYKNQIDKALESS